MKKIIKPMLTKQHELLRMNWTKVCIHWKTEWDRVLFSDEKKFNWMVQMDIVIIGMT